MNNNLLQRIASAKLPTSAGLFSAVAFRQSDSGLEHLALVAESAGGTPLVRLHSECLTGDVLGSRRCDCGAQLLLAQQLIGREGGALLYLRQEGRGIGLINKIRAYALQDQGRDTVDANLELGFADDARDYLVAAEMLRALEITQVRLLTNNPAKIDGLQKHGIVVLERVPLIIPANKDNAHYLDTKRARLNHMLPKSSRETRKEARE